MAKKIRSAMATDTTRRNGMVLGRMKVEIAAVMTESIRPLEQVNMIVLPQYFEKVDLSLATCLMRIFPDPMLAKGAIILTNAVTPIKAPYPSAPSALAMSMK